MNDSIVSISCDQFDESQSYGAIFRKKGRGLPNAYFDYYDISRNEICHYKTSSRYEEPLVTMWSDELIFKSGDYNNNPREFGWELIVNE